MSAYVRTVYESDEWTVMTVTLADGSERRFAECRFRIMEGGFLQVAREDLEVVFNSDAWREVR